MGIPNELSSDVAAAILAGKDQKVQAEPKELIEIVRNFHTAMRHLAVEERRRRIAASFTAESSRVNRQIVSGRH